MVSPFCIRTSSTLLWTGIGGFPVSGNGSGVEDVLMQNGLTIGTPFSNGSFSNGSPAYGLFYQLWPVDNGLEPPLPAGKTINPDDAMLFEGYTASSSACSTNSTSSHAYACYYFWDYSQGWSIGPLYIQYENPMPTGTQWTWNPATIDYIAELPIVDTAISNTDYYYTETEGGGFDTTGAYHPDPGGSGSDDPYLAVFAEDPSDNLLNYPAWANGSYNNAVDPIYLWWNASQ